MINIICISLMAIGTLLSPTTYAEEEKERTYLQLGSYIHFNDSEDHTEKPFLASIERHKPNRWFYGLALFNNSFDQFSQYIYVGKTFKTDNETLKNWHLKLSGGLVHGYKDEYQDKIPFNDYGVAPAIIPTLGYKKEESRWGADLIVLGGAGLLFSVGYDL
ncbi:MAG: hypothetical protein GY696_39400 [Gammaproteobacteria bacterium]|nr:hypothetical protein [Gammaproteobacteria bacterium]